MSQDVLLHTLCQSYFSCCSVFNLVADFELQACLSVVALLAGEFSRQEGRQADCRPRQASERRCVAGRFHSRQHSTIDGTDAGCKRHTALDHASLCLATGV